MAGDEIWAEIERLYRERFASFLRVARAVTGERETALEAVQEGFADALRNSVRFTGRGPLEGWVWRCVVNRARKARRPQLPTVDVAPVANGADGFVDGEVRTRLAALPERQRLVVFLRYFADLEYRDIASALGIETGTVSATLSAAHAALRTQLEEIRT
jgi:DNA-directed RNA polymerase specialized sigma24 family protein